MILAAVLMNACGLRAAPPGDVVDEPIRTAGAPTQRETSSEETPPSVAVQRDRSTTKRPKKVPAHAMRAGLDVTPPRIDRFTPTPGAWVVGLIGVPAVKIGFDEPMAMPITAGAVTAWTVGGGDVTGSRLRMIRPPISLR